MRKLKRFTICMLVGLMGFGCAACGSGGGSGGDGDAHTLTIYKARATGMVDGTEEDKVKEAIESKFYEDTGIKISLDVKMYTDADLTTKVDTNWAKRSADMDAVIHYTSEDSGSAIKKYAASEDTVHEVTGLLDKYGQNIWKYIRQNDTEHIGERSAYMPYSDGTYSMNLIPGVEAEQGYAMLIRKDYMQKLYDDGHITFSPDDFDVNNENYRNMTFSEFNTFLYACKENIADMRYPISGAPWDLNRVLGGVFSADLYSIQKNDEGNYVPAQFIPETGDFLEQMRIWAKKGIWEAESANMPDSTRNSNFLAGYSAVYCSYPQIDNLISVARMFNIANPNSELMVIAPLADDSGTVNGYMSMPRSFSGLILPDRANADTELVVRYVDWLYSDVENYELSKYGIKGQHWIEGDDYTYGGTTYKTWLYPDGKEDEFNLNPPYSGQYCILPNINVSNRLRGDYNSMEKMWYVLATHEFEPYRGRNEQGIWLPETPREYKSMYNSIDGNYVEKIRSVAWAGLGDVSVQSLLATYIDECYAISEPYLTFVDTSIKASLTYFGTLFKD